MNRAELKDSGPLAMTVSTMPPAVATLVERRAIGPADVSRLRATVYGDAVVSREEAEWAFALDEAAAETCPEWTEFFVESVVDYVVRREAPEGYVSADTAAWLTAAIARDGIVRTASELEALVRVVEVATEVPAALSAFALRQVAAAVVDGDGPLARGRKLEPGVIGADEVALIRRVLYAYGGERTVGITREEAEVLFDLNDRTSEADNDPSWSDLFVKAVANFLMAARGYAVLSREEALRREAWLDAPSGGVTALFGDMMSALLSNGLKTVWSAWRRGEEEDLYAGRIRALEAESRAAEAVTADEVRWLADRIGRDGVIHANERALLRFLAEESPDLHPSLRTLLDTAA
ncbi:hypothetical protein GCM10007904_37660 [Oharaeibacter diazotrophicus]|nr:hypothetical protein GCM10007904_37660 [Oharaeibacter diazotrophicus]